MHKSSKYGDQSRAGNEDAPTVVSCAYFSCRSLWSSSATGSFCIPPQRFNGKDTKMKSNETTKCKSQCKPGCLSYLTADRTHYCYEYWDGDAGHMVSLKLEVGKDLSPELTIILDELDHEMDLKERYDEECRDALFIRKMHNYSTDPSSEGSVDPWDTISDRSNSPEDIIFAESEPENPMVAQVRRIIDEECTESQQELFHGHFGEMKQLKEMVEVEGSVTGSQPSAAAMTNRKNKLIKKVAKAFGVEPVKRRKYPNKG